MNFYNIIYQTHFGIFDIALTRSIQNLVCLALTCKEEHLAMLDLAVEQTEVPVIIRLPGIFSVSRPDVKLAEIYNLPKKGFYE